MKRNLLLLAVVATVLLFASQTWAQCSEDPIDLGICDTLYVETFDCFHTYEHGMGYDSVLVAMWVTHDSNTFYWDGGQRWVQDSIAGFVIPLSWKSVGCATNVDLPYAANSWNNLQMSPYSPFISRSMFRHITDQHTGITYNNRMQDLAALFGGFEWSPTVDIFTDDPEDTGHCWFSLLPTGTTNMRWWEGSRVLLATMTFLITMEDPCDSSEICLDSMFWPPSSELAFTRYDAVNYVPRHFLPVCDTIYIIPNLPPELTCPGDEAQGCNGTGFVSGQFTVTDADNNISSVSVSYTGNGVANEAVINVTGLGTQSVTGNVQYDVTDHCQPDGFFTVTAMDEIGATGTCTFNLDLSNVAPTITCPGDVSGQYHNTLVSGDFTAFDECGVANVSMTYTGTPTNAPTLVGQHVEWDAFCTETITVTLTVTDDCQATASCDFDMTGQNTPPSCDFNLPPSTTINSTITVDYSIIDPNGGASLSGIVADCGAISNVTATTFDYTAPGDADTCCVTMTVVDECGATNTCEDCIEIVAAANQVIIPNKVYERFGFGHWDYDGDIMMDDACYPWYGINPGDFFEIPIMLNSFQAQYPIGAFELEVEFDYIDLTFYGAMRGCLLENRDWQIGVPPGDSTFWSWEYFTYRVLPCPQCACCKYKILLYGQAEMPDGQLRRGYCLQAGGADYETYWCEDFVTMGDYEGDKIGATLVWLKFQVANNELLRDLKLPIFFEFEHKLLDGEIVQDWDCAENTFSSCDGNDLYVSKDPMQYALGVCPDGDHIFPILDFIDGGVHICSPCTAFTCVRGDINMNEIAYEAADAVLYARYFVFGVEVFTIDMDNQICASDVNADGRTLMLADLIYLIRVIQHDAIAYPKLGPSTDVANLIVSDGVVSVECASAIGGILFEFDGAVTPSLLNTDMEMLYNQGKVLVWSSEGKSINAGTSEILSVDGELVSVIAVDREGRDLATTVTTKVAPSAFALHPAYPNPFNPYTNLSFTLPNAASYSMKIYNVAGQLVRSYDGMGNAGMNVITWDGRDNAGSDVSSGVYFFKVIAGPFTATNKMVLMK